MKKGDKVFQSDLLKAGFTQIDIYGDCEIWSNNQDRLLWNPITRLIVVYYQKQ